MRRALLALLLVATSLPACPGTADDTPIEALDSTEHTVSESAFLLTLSEGVPPTGDPALVATMAAGRDRPAFQPAGCLQARAVGPTVTYVFNGCNGSLGLTRVSGTLTATYAAMGSGLVVRATSTGLRVDGATLDLVTESTWTQSERTLSVHVDARSSGVGPHGTRLARTGTYTLDLDLAARCLTLDGEWSTRVGLRTASTRVTHFRKCDGRCPQAGGTVEYTGGALRQTITLVFPGSATARWSSTTGRSGILTLGCTV